MLENLIDVSQTRRYVHTNFNQGVLILSILSRMRNVLMQAISSLPLNCCEHPLYDIVRILSELSMPVSSRALLLRPYLLT